jgi:hypothetical protein
MLQGLTWAKSMGPAARYADFCGREKLHPATAEARTRFLHFELHNSFQQLGAQLRGTKGLGNARPYWEKWNAQG